MNRKVTLIGWVIFCLCCALFVFADDVDKRDAQNSERSVKQAEVPARALAGLKKVAGDATLTEFAEEVEHGHKFYDGSFKGPDGNVDVLVTEAGDVVEVEESIPIGKAPEAVRLAAEQQAGKIATYERKTLYLYEIHFEKDGKERELVFTTDARPYLEKDGSAEKE